LIRMEKNGVTRIKFWMTIKLDHTPQTKLEVPLSFSEKVIQKPPWRYKTQSVVPLAKKKHMHLKFNTATAKNCHNDAQLNSKTLRPFKNKFNLTSSLSGVFKYLSSFPPALASHHSYKLQTKHWWLALYKLVTRNVPKTSVEQTKNNREFYLY
jgi:hypothetical protein